MGVDLGLHLPLDSSLCAGDRGGAGAGGRDRRQHRRKRAGEGRERQDRDVGRWLGGRRTEQRVERLEEHIGRRDQRDTADAEAMRPRAGPGRKRHRVAGRDLERGGELLVEDDLPATERAAQKAESADVIEIARRHS